MRRCWPSTAIAEPDNNGVDQPSVVSCDNIITIDKVALGRHLGFLFELQEPALTAAIVNAFALRSYDLT